jgi:hypothetical protein
MKRSLWYFFFLSLLVLLGVCLALFLNQNTDPVVLYFGASWLGGFLRTSEIAQGHLLLITFLLGIFCSGFTLAGQLISRTLELRRVKRELEALQRTLQIQSQKDKTPQ